ncbi:hypothetical protein [Methylomicrobium lacus]|uniref:hypothetical protein n=1 Tax=Methylomicrobium lacus TaxID=136992 RepID=UPI0035A8650A
MPRHRATSRRWHGEAIEVSRENVRPGVGREASLAHLQQLREKAVAGRRQLAFVTGEAGIG